MPDGNQIVFYGTTGTGGTSDGDAQSDPASYLGRYRSSTVLHDLQSTLTAAQVGLSDRHIFVDSARIGDGADVHAFKWLFVYTGPAALSFGRVMAFDDATGTFELDRPALGTAASGDDYALFESGNVWPDVTAEQAAAGDTRYRCIVARNETGGTLTNVRIWQFPVGQNGMGSIDLARIAQVGLIAPGSPFIERSTDTDDILTPVGARDPQGGPDRFVGSSGWISPFGRTQAATEIASWTNNATLAIWLRRQVAAARGPRTSVAHVIICDTDVTGQDPDPLISGAIFPHDLLGSQTASLQADRYGAVGGGARYTGFALDVTGAPIPGRPLRWGLRAGDLGAVFTDDDPLAEYDTSNSAGEVFATFRAPTLPVAEGQTSHVQLILGSATERANPKPRVTLASIGTLRYAGSADLTIPSSFRSSLTVSGGFQVGS